MSSRASLLSGIYPSHIRFTGGASQDGDMPGVVSLPMHFRNNNYQTVSLGKVYHYFDDGKGSWDSKWTPPITTTRIWDYQSKEGIRIFEERNKELQSDSRMRDQGNSPLPFFLAVGFKKPHLPFNAPLKY